MGACRAMAARRRAECEETYAPLITALLAEKKYAAAADLQAKMDKEINEAEAKQAMAARCRAASARRSTRR